MRILPLVTIIPFLALAWYMLGSTGEQLAASDLSPEHDVVIFTAPWCGYCDQARSYLQRNQVEFLEIDIEASTEARRRWHEAGGRGLPLTFIGETRVDGFSTEAYQRALQQIPTR